MKEIVFIRNEDEIDIGVWNDCINQYEFPDYQLSAEKLKEIQKNMDIVFVSRAKLDIFLDEVKNEMV